MKLFLKIVAGLLLFLLLLVAGLSLYFSDERLREMIVPPVSEALERDVQIERISFTFFRTFPRFGLLVRGFELPGRDDEEAAASFEELTASVRLLPLFRSELAISRLQIDRPVVRYRVYPDSTGSFDYLLDDDPEERIDEPAEPGFTLRIPDFRINDARFIYRSDPQDLTADLDGLDAVIGLRYAEQIETSMDASLRSLSIRSKGSETVSGLPLRLRQRSLLDLENEELLIEEGSLSIRGFSLNLNGSLSRWGDDRPLIDLGFSSSTDDFGELLGLAPPELDDLLRGVESGGSLALEGHVRGELAGDEIPDFRLSVEITDGFLRNPELEEPIEAIALSLTADNTLVTITRLEATAAGNRFEASGLLERPFDEDAPFSFRMNGDLDLGTVSRFYPLGEAGIERLEGRLSTRAEGEGELDRPESARFDASFTLHDGIFKYVDVPGTIEQIEADIEATQDRIDIRAASMRAAGNRLSINGSITDPLADLPSFDLDASIDFDLGTIGDFYPIDPDTLTLRGRLTAEASLRGQADQLERALRQSRIDLRDGYIDHRIVARPLEEITFSAEADSRVLSIREARFRSGENRLALNGRVENYLDDEPLFDLMIEGEATLADVTTYYSLEPWIDKLEGSAALNLRARGPAGDPTAIALDGALELDAVSADGDSLYLPVTGLGGRLSVTPQRMQLDGFSMNYGSSDISLQGGLDNYLGFLREHDSEATMPVITGSYRSRLLNMDEMIDWDVEREDPLLIELPQLIGRVDAAIDTLLIFDVPIYNLRGGGRLDPSGIRIENASAELFDGTANGDLVWNVPRPDFTTIRFQGGLTDLQVEAFFREFPILGENSRFEQFVTGGFSAQVDYYTELDEYIDPDITETRAEGTFGMSRARLRGHPLQEQLARWLGANELRSLALDEWTASFRIHESVLTLNDFRLTSDNIGIELDGTQNLVTDEIDFTAQLFLPSRFRSGLASVISSRAVDALTRDDGIIAIPVRISGTMESPRITPRESIIEDLLRDTGRDLIRGLFNRN